MKGIPLISGKRIVAELFSDFNLTGTDWVNKIPRYIVRALGIMQIDGYYELAFKDLTIEEYRAMLPCDRKYILGVVIIDGESISQLPLDRKIDLGTSFKDLSYHSFYSGTINGNWLHTTYPTGKVRIIYHRPPICTSGYPMIPDNDFVFEAIPYYIINRLSLGGYKHAAISRKEAYEMWNTLYPRARNDMNYPSLHEMQHFTEVYTSPLYSNILKITSIPNITNIPTTSHLDVVLPFRSMDDTKSSNN